MGALLWLFVFKENSYWSDFLTKLLYFIASLLLLRRAVYCLVFYVRLWLYVCPVSSSYVGLEADRGNIC